MNSLIQLHVKRNKGKLYAAFIDFKSAFPSVSHQLLWEKLYHMGLSSKIINILKDLYRNAAVRVRGCEGMTDSIKISKGVLQGETLSPLLFSLFIADLESFLLSKNIRGVSVSHLKEIILLAYADDLLLLADSYIGMVKLLRELHSYCQNNKLEINFDKNLLYFCKKGGMAIKEKSTIPVW